VEQGSLAEKKWQFWPYTQANKTCQLVMTSCNLRSRRYSRARENGKLEIPPILSCPRIPPATQARLAVEEGSLAGKKWQFWPYTQANKTCQVVMEKTCVVCAETSPITSKAPTRSGKFYPVTLRSGTCAFHFCGRL
jgi:hypothetical protein